MQKPTELTPFEKEIIREHRKKLKKGRLLNCKYCGHVWIYKGKKKKGHTSCPKCQFSVNVIKRQVDQK